jgi:hypothetical protein
MGLFDQIDQPAPRKKRVKLLPGDRVRWVCPEVRRKGIVREVQKGGVIVMFKRDKHATLVGIEECTTVRINKKLRRGRWVWYVRPERQYKGRVREVAGDLVLVALDDPKCLSQVPREQLKRLKKKGKR